MHTRIIQQRPWVDLFEGPSQESFRVECPVEAVSPEASRIRSELFGAGLTSRGCEGLR